MAVSYLKLERVAPIGDVYAVEANDVLIFDTVVSNDGLIEYDTEQGIITFHEAGFYYVDWFVAPQFGLTTDGSNWAIQTTKSELSIIGSSHTKVSVTTGFAILEAEAEETAKLVNVSDGAISLSQAVQTKASLVVYNVAVMSIVP